MRPEWIKDFETLFSLLGFVITLYVLYEVRAIRRAFKSRARLPEIAKDLSAAGSEISKLLRDWPSNRPMVKGQFKIVVTLLNVALEFVSGSQRADIKRVRLRIKNALPSFSDGTDAWELYTDIQTSIQTLSQATKNAKWD
jgi:hypothetical protein